MKKLIIASTAALFLQGCYLTPSFQAQPLQQQKADTTEYSSTVVSEKKNTVIVQVDKYINAKFDKPALKVTFMNKDKTPIEFGMSNINVFVDDQQIALVDPEQAKDERERRFNLMTTSAGNRDGRGITASNGKAASPSTKAYSPGVKESHPYGKFIDSQLKNTLVSPDHLLMGYVTLDTNSLAKTSKLKVIVTVDNEEHVFNVSRV